MNIERRNFLKRAGGLAGTLSAATWLDKLSAAGFESRSRQLADLPAKEVAKDEDFWNWVRQAYTVSPNIIDLNNGGVSPQPRVVQEAMIRYYEMANEGPSLYMWDYLDKGREQVRRDLARLAGCSSDEIAINRNATEALDNAIFGIDLEPGDEVLMTKQDYPNMINAWKLREKRHGIKLNQISLDLPMEDEDAIVAAFEKGFTDKTKVLHLTHIINWMGQILPAKRIIAAARKRGIQVVLDGAHSFGHFRFSLHDLDPDYFGTSLHKWLCAPFGSGFLYVKKERIKGLWPLMSAPDPQADDIRKFENLGTRSFPIEQAIGAAVSFHDGIGSERKEERLRYLKNYWCTRAKSIPGVKIHTSLQDKWSCAISLFSIEGRKPGDIKNELQTKYQIHTVAIEWENIIGVRVTPHVYTSLSDLDKLVDAISRIAQS